MARSKPVSFSSGTTWASSAAPAVDGTGAARFSLNHSRGPGDCYSLDVATEKLERWTNSETAAKIIIDTRRARFVVMKHRLEAFSDFRQR